MKNGINVMLVEDNPAYRKSIGYALNGRDGINLLHQFGTAEIAIQSLLEMDPAKIPDVVLLDLNLPGMSGLEVLPWFKKYIPDANVIVLTQSDAEADVLHAIQEGAMGYLLKSSTVKQIKEAIRSVMDGGSTLDGKVAKFIVTTFNERVPKHVQESTLSQRELEILTLLSEGLVKKEIGDRLNIGYSSVATYTRRIYVKLNVVNAPAAVSKAFRAGILTTDK
jgi:DNA-binding NarL/FixJ family response regulator